MSYLDPQRFGAFQVQDMAAVASRDAAWPAYTRGFRIDIWDLNMDGNSERPTLRLIDGGGLHTTGYDWARWDKQNAAAYAQEGTLQLASQTWFDNFGPANTGLVTGWWEGRLVDPAAFIWSIYGRFRDDQAVEQTRLEIFGQVALDSACTGARVASGNASTWTAGSMGYQSW